MSIREPRFIFACLCWVGMLVIFLATIWEIKGGFAREFLGKRFFWARMVSAVCWLAALGLLSMAVTVKWPVVGDDRSKQEFAQYLLSGTALLAVALLISFVDFVLSWYTRNKYRNQFADRMEKLVHEHMDDVNDEESK